MKTRTKDKIMRLAALIKPTLVMPLCMLVACMASNVKAVGYNVAETRTFSTAETANEAVWIGNDNSGVFTYENALVWQSENSSDANGLSINGDLRLADWGASAERPLYGSLNIKSGTYTAWAAYIGKGSYNYGYLKIDGGTLHLSGDYHLGFNSGTESTLTITGGTAKSDYWFCTGRFDDNTGGGKATVAISGGQLLVGQGSAANGMFDLGCSSGSATEFTMTGGYAYAPGSKNESGAPAMSIASATGSSASVTLSGDAELELGSHVVVGNWGSGTLTLNGGKLKAPAIKSNSDSNSLTLNGGTLEASEAGEFIDSGITMTVGSNGGTIDVGGNNVTVAAAVTGSGSIIKKGSGTLEFTGDMSGFTGQIIVAEGGAVTVSATGTSATPGVGTAQNGLLFTTAATTYVWTGAANDGGNWNNKDNWNQNGATATDYPNSSGAIVSIAQNAEIVLSANQLVSSLVLAGDLTLSGNSTYGLTGLTSISGNGVLILNNSGIENANSANLDFSNPVKIKGTTKNWLTAVGNGQTGHFIKVRGNLSGEGYVELSPRGGWYSAVQLFGNNESFAGKAYVYVPDIKVSGATLKRGSSVFQSADSASSNAQWVFGDLSYTSPFNFTEGTIKFGTLECENNFTMPANSKLTFEVGNRCGADQSFTWSSTVNRGANSDAVNVVKVGSGTLNFTGQISSNKAGGALTIKDGTVVLNKATQQVQSIVFAGGTLGIGSSVEYNYSSLIADSEEYPVSISIADATMNYSLSTSLTSTKTSGLVKKGAGTLTLTTSPTYTGTTTVEAGELVLPDGKTSLDGLVLDGGSITANGVTSYGDVTINSGTLNVAKNATIGTLTIADGATLALTGDGGATITVTSFADGDTTKSRITTPTGTTLSWEGNVGTLVRSAYTYTWTDATGDHAWENHGNWTIPVNEVATIPGYLPSDIDTVQFTSSGAPWTVELAGDQTVGAVIFSGESKLSGANLFSSAYSGNGKVVLGDDAGIGNDNVAITIANPIEIAGTGVHTNKLYANGKYLTVSGELTGSGNLNLVASYDSLGVSLTGANKMTSGSIVVENTLTAYGQARRNCSRIKPVASNSNLVWKVSNGANNKHTGNYSFLNGEGTYYFGSINNINQPAGLKNSIVEIGALVAAGETCAVGGVFYSVDSQVSGRLWNSQYTSTTLRKVGAGTISTSMQSIYNYDVVSGTLELAVDNARPAADGTIKFSGNGTLALNDAFTYDVSTNIAAVIASTPYQITVDTGTTPRTWEVAIPNNYTGGFTKKGAGTLTLSQPPAYTGATTVEEGTLITPNTFVYTLGAHTKVEAVGDTYEFTKAELAPDGTSTISADTAEDAAAIAEQYVVTPTAEQTAAGVESGYYKVVATATDTDGVYVLNVKFADDVVPKVTEEPTISDTTVTFAVTNFKKGLYYGVATGTSPNVSKSGVALSRATDNSGTGVTLSAGMPSSGVMYYEIVVSDTATAE